MPDTVKLTCPLCKTVFQARTMGSSFYIAGVETDLRETGSIEDVRRFSVACCPCCGFGDYTWNFLAPDELTGEERTALAKALGFDKKRPRRAGSRRYGDFERFELAGTCFRARGMDPSALAELALSAYHVARDLGRRDLEPRLRAEAAALFERALEEEDLPPELRLRYAYLAGELRRRAGDREPALAAFEKAIAAADEAGDLHLHQEGAPVTDLGRFARRMQATLLYRDAPAATLLELTAEEDPELASTARRLLARRRDRAGVEAVRAAWRKAPPGDRSAMLQELATDPAAGLFDLLVEALDGAAPEDVRVAARALGALGDPRGAPGLLAALERGVLSTEVALVEALRKLDAPGRDEALLELLDRWEAQAAATGDPDEDAWRFTSDPTPIRNLLYGSGHPRGLELLIRDLKAIHENDLWDKVPSGGPVSAALVLEPCSAQVGSGYAARAKDGPGQTATLALRGLLSAHNPAARRWACYCVAELGDAQVKGELRELVEDPDRCVRLQAAWALARLGDASHEAVVLEELRALGNDDVPFALHFLVPFRSGAVKAFLLQLLDQGKATAGEVLPLLGRQESDDRVAALLSQSLLDTNDDTRAGGVTGLAFQGGKGGNGKGGNEKAVAGRLRGLYDGEESDEVCRRIVFGLGQLARQGVEREETIRFLRERLGRGHHRLRFAIALTLLSLDDPSGIDIVRERAALFDESYERYDLVAPALKVLAAYDARRAALSTPTAAAAR